MPRFLDPTIEKDKRQTLLFFDKDMYASYLKYCDRFPGTTLKGFVHLALEYYLSWRLKELSLAIPEQWTILSKSPVDLELAAESPENYEAGHISSTKIRDYYLVEVTRVADVKGWTKRKVILTAIKAYLYDRGFLK